MTVGPGDGFMDARFAHEPSDDLKEVNERLLIAGLRNHELADQLQQQLSYTRAVTDSLDEGVCALNRDGRIVFANSAASDMLDKPESELLGRVFHDLVHVDCDANCRLLHALRSATEFISTDDVFAAPAWRTRPVSYTATPVSIQDQVVGAVVAFRDITDRKRFEEAREALLLHERTARSEAEAAVQLRSEVLSAVSHDLRTPLTLVKGFAQRLLNNSADREELDKDRLKYGLQQIETAATKMVTILGDLLDVATLEAGRSLELQRTRVDLGELATVSINEHQDLSKHRLVLEVHDGPLVGSWDKLRLERVLHNLLSNAIKYSPDGSCITVKLERADADDEWVVLEVCDHGVGVPAAELPHIFTRFYRATNTTGSTTGVGIGLAVTKEIIETHGGGVVLESTEGVGTTVTVRLPVMAGAA